MKKRIEAKIERLKKEFPGASEMQYLFYAAAEIALEMFTDIEDIKKIVNKIKSENDED